ncbi:MAG: thioesterase family protein [Pseudomonadota bacterium]
MTGKASGAKTGAIPEGARFRHRLRTRFFEVDAHGQVHNAYYLVYAEEAVTAFLNDLGCAELIEPGAGGSIFVVVRSAVDYLHPVGFDETLVLAVWVRRLGRSSLTFAVTAAKEAGDVAADVEIVWVCKDTATGRSTPLAPALVERLQDVVFAAVGDSAP